MGSPLRPAIPATRPPGTDVTRHHHDHSPPVAQGRDEPREWSGPGWEGVDSPPPLHRCDLEVPLLKVRPEFHTKPLHLRLWYMSMPHHSVGENPGPLVPFPHVRSSLSGVGSGTTRWGSSGARDHTHHGLHRRKTSLTATDARG